MYVRMYVCACCTCIHITHVSAWPWPAMGWGTQLSYRPVHRSAHFTSVLDVDKKLLPDMTAGAADALHRQAANLEAEVLLLYRGTSVMISYLNFS